MRDCKQQGLGHRQSWRFEGTRIEYRILELYTVKNLAVSMFAQYLKGKGEEAAARFPRKH